MVMSCKERTRACDIVQVFDDGARDGESIIGAGSPADFIQDNQAMLCRVMEDGGRFFHFHHKGAFPRSDIIFGAHTRKNAIDKTEARAASRHETTDLR